MKAHKKIIQYMNQQPEGYVVHRRELEAALGIPGATMDRAIARLKNTKGLSFDVVTDRRGKSFKTSFRKTEVVKSEVVKSEVVKSEVVKSEVVKSEVVNSSSQDQDEDNPGDFIGTEPVWEGEPAKVEPAKVEPAVEPIAGPKPNLFNSTYVSNLSPEEEAAIDRAMTNRAPAAAAWRVTREQLREFYRGLTWPRSWEQMGVDWKVQQAFDCLCGAIGQENEKLRRNSRRFED